MLGDKQLDKSTPVPLYYQLKDMIYGVRNRYDVPNLPFIAADFVLDWKSKNMSDCIPIVEKIKNVTLTIGNAGFVQTDGLLSNDQANQNGDDIHFSRKALYELGNRYFDVFKTLVN